MGQPFAHHLLKSGFKVQGFEQGSRVGSPMLITSLWAQNQQAAYEKGLGDFDSVAYFEVLRELAGLPRRG
jgi:hypothetical protein